MKGGFLSLYKPEGISSFKVLGSVKKYFDTKKVGHLGTLDPLAEGVLAVAVDEATKLIPYIDTEPKVYECEIYFGQSSETLDREGVDMGNLLTIDKCFEEGDLIKVLDSFVGEVEQVPPIFSALKIDGVRAYKKAREGSIEESEMKSRKVNLFKVELLEFSWPIAKIKIECGSGFYVRSLVRDIGRELEVDTFMYSLKRTSVGQFTVENSCLPDQSYGYLAIEQLLSEYERLDLSPGNLTRARNGQEINGEVVGTVFGYFEGNLCTIFEGDGKKYKVKKNLND